MGQSNVNVESTIWHYLDTNMKSEWIDRTPPNSEDKLLTIIFELKLLIVDLEPAVIL